jgi:hypothetical protein
MMRRWPAAALAASLLFSFGAAGCSKPDKVASVDTVVSEQPLVATIALDDSRAESEGVITVTAAFGPAVTASQVGAFTMRLAFDATRLAFTPTGTTVVGTGAASATGGVVKIASVAIDGFPSGPLFAARFTIREPTTDALGTLRLTVDELSGVDFSNRLPAGAAAAVIER